ncbi:DNA repair protein RecN [Gilvibacter sp.]|uniref:DNA repair protein RecN n=1 Tax=Gilvibacter sp. TaxID=2729997 RepID=UPI003F49B725
MIKSLSIKNYALIDHLAVDFGPGFTVITGETGAGKSIVLGALGLLLGQRADLDSIKDKTTKSVIEGHFDLSKFKLQEFFKENDLDFDLHTIIRRELLPSGKSRAFVNDTPVNLSVLSILGEQLIDIHSQGQQLEVNTTAFKFNLVDLIADNKNLLSDYREAFRQYKQAQKDLASLKETQASANKEFDYNKFLWTELHELQLDKLDEAAIDEEYETLSNVERIQDLLAEVMQQLSAEQVGASEQLGHANQQLGQLARISPLFKELSERMQSIHIELTDLESQLFEQQEQIESDPDRLASLEELTRSLYDLKRKHAASSLEELIAKRDALEKLVVMVEDQSEQLLAAEQALVKAEQKMESLARELQSARAAVIPQLCETINAQLRMLELPAAQFVIQQNNSEANPYGQETLEFLFSANKGVTPGPLQKVASGGELSRVMLALKALMAQHTNLATLIFDEIDTGVSGEVANRIGDIMRQMSRSMQLLSITHLPQVAAKGNHHFKVFKEDTAQGAATRMRALSSEERVVEIAQMLGGQQLSETALNHAKELLN